MMKRAAGLFSALLIMLLVAATGEARAEEGLAEYRLKAAFLYHFFNFVEWPTASLDSPTLCVVGDDPFGEALDSIEGKLVHGRPLIVRRIPSGGTVPPDCDILFVARSEKQRWPAIARSLAGTILTVSDIDRFSRTGGVIEMYLEQRKVRLAVSLESARTAGVAISSRLLSLAERVDE